MSEHYSVSTEGSPEPRTRTPGLTPGDWDAALAEAQQRAKDSEHNQVIRAHTREGGRIIATATPDGIAWPRMATPLWPELASGDAEPEIGG